MKRKTRTLLSPALVGEGVVALVEVVVAAGELVFEVDVIVLASGYLLEAYTKLRRQPLRS